MALNQPINYNVNLIINCGYEYVVTDSTYKTLSQAMKRYKELKNCIAWTPVINEIF